MENQSYLAIDLGGTKIRYCHYIENCLSNTTTDKSPKSPRDLIEYLERLFKRYPSKNIHLSVPGPMPQGKNIDECTITLPPLNYAISSKLIQDIVPRETSFLLMNDMYSYIGVLDELSSNKLGVITIGTSTGLGIYEKANESIIFNSFEVAHEEASKHLPAKKGYTIKEILSGSAIGKGSMHEALSSDGARQYNSVEKKYYTLEFTFFLEKFCHSIAEKYALDKLYIAGGGLIKAYGENYLESRDIRNLILQGKKRNIMIRFLGVSYNYLNNTIELIKIVIAGLLVQVY